MPRTTRILASLGAIAAAATIAQAAGLPLDIQAVNTDALPDIGEEWLTENPYREQGEEVWAKAIEIGASGYNQNCARCHGLGAVSGGLAPDLRFLEAEEYGDEWYMERFRHGFTQNGVTRMPAFGDLLGQKAAWAIRTYLETRPDEDAVSARSAELKALRDTLAAGDEVDAEAVKAELSGIAEEIETLSGAPVADSIAYRAAAQIDGTPESFHKAAETLTVGLSAAQ
ncbi:MAG: cytochrome c-550 PedF [Limimaricola soesokkakensis]|uniref:cytochrome c-550 PedF n=1 Tax=Limimaricola soesokkakensis TaxID=1343159 RepID=UPI00405918C6